MSVATGPVSPPWTRVPALYTRFGYPITPTSTVIHSCYVDLTSPNALQFVDADPGGVLYDAKTLRFMGFTVTHPWASPGPKLLLLPDSVTVIVDRVAVSFPSLRWSVDDGGRLSPQAASARRCRVVAVGAECSGFASELSPVPNAHPFIIPPSASFPLGSQIPEAAFTQKRSNVLSGATGVVLAVGCFALLLAATGTPVRERVWTCFCLGARILKRKLL